jgi:hypothetical protein
VFVEIPHRTFIDFVKTLHNFTEAMVLILAATVNSDLTVIVNGGYISDTFVEVFYNINTQLQIVELQDHGRCLLLFVLMIRVFITSILEGDKGGTFRTVEEVQDIDEFFKLTPLQDGIDAIGDSWFNCQKLTIPIGAVEHIVIIFALVSCTQLESELSNLKTSRNINPYSLLLAPNATISSWRNATQLWLGAVRCIYKGNFWKVEQLLFSGKILIILQYQFLVPLYGYNFYHSVALLSAYKYILKSINSYDRVIGILDCILP